MQAFDLMKDYMSGVIEHSGKMVVLMEIIEQCIMLQEKILIFRYFVTLTCSEQNDTEFEVTIEQQMLTLCDLETGETLQCHTRHKCHYVRHECLVTVFFFSYACHEAQLTYCVCFGCSQSLFTLGLIEEYLAKQHVPGTDEMWTKNKNYFRMLMTAFV